VEVAVTLTELLAIATVVAAYAVLFALPTENYTLQGDGASRIFATGYIASEPDTLTVAGESSYPAIASAYAHHGRTACMTRTKLAPFRTLAMSTRFREENGFVYGDTFTIPAFPDVTWVLEDHLPKHYGRDLDLFLGDYDKARKWGVREVELTIVGHLEHPKGLYAKKEEYLGTKTNTNH